MSHVKIRKNFQKIHPHIQVSHRTEVPHELFPQPCTWKFMGLVKKTLSADIGAEKTGFMRFSGFPMEGFSCCSHPILHESLNRRHDFHSSFRQLVEKTLGNDLLIHRMWKSLLEYVKKRNEFSFVPCGKVGSIGGDGGTQLF